MAGYSSATRQGISVGEQARDTAGAISQAATPTPHSAKKMAARAGAANMRSFMIAGIKNVGQEVHSLKNIESFCLKQARRGALVFPAARAGSRAQSAS